ncbi:hypothetical protein I3760_15G067000 [Carya illinoinensis]|uniref:Uncharacterized protein n=1 Tax=Carya illinoinensis TaxID=32201 RepID=A0A922A9J7_CARIL|nr:hypothetical protein I3760_15G067000 [Carya illinoinensis]KAG6674851.1 hypothetical protein I3842_15G067400 [Carya illinoinensis]
MKLWKSIRKLAAVCGLVFAKLISSFALVHASITIYLNVHNSLCLKMIGFAIQYFLKFFAGWSFMQDFDLLWFGCCPSVGGFGSSFTLNVRFVYAWGCFLMHSILKTLDIAVAKLRS